LGRHNDIYEAPRGIITAATGKAPRGNGTQPQARLLLRRRRRTDVAGRKLGTRINIERRKRPESDRRHLRGLSLLHDDVADGLKDKGADSKVQVLDVAEIVAKALPK